MTEEAEMKVKTFKSLAIVFITLSFAQDEADLQEAAVRRFA